MCSTVGLAGDEDVLALPPHKLLEGRTIKGSPAGDVKGRSDIPTFARGISEGSIGVESLLTARMPLDDLEAMFAGMH